MQVALENLSGLERKLTITVPAENVDKEVLAQLHKMAAKAKISGFRPGKVPFALLQKRYGEAVRQDVIGDVMYKSFSEAIKQEKISPAAYPKIDVINSKPNEPLSFTAIFEIYPEVSLGDLSRLEVTRHISEITDRDVEGMIEQMRKESVSWKEIKDSAKGAEKGDRLNVDFTISVHTDKVPIPKVEKDVNFVLGSGFMWAEFEAPLYKCKAGDELKFTLKFPLTHRDKELVGRYADFKVKIHKVFAPHYPELNDEFAKKYGVKEGGIEGLKQEVRKNMERELNKNLKLLLKGALLDKLYDYTPVEVPKVLAAKELKQLKERWEQRYAHAAKGEKEPEFPQKEYESRARRFVALGLILASVIKENEIKVEPQELRAKVEDLVSVYEDNAKAINWYYSDKDRLAEVESMLLEEKAIDFLSKSVKLVDKPISYKDALERVGG